MNLKECVLAMIAVMVCVFSLGMIKEYYQDKKTTKMAEITTVSESLKATTKDTLKLVEEILEVKCLPTKPNIKGPAYVCMDSITVLSLKEVQAADKLLKILEAKSDWPEKVWFDTKCTKVDEDKDMTNITRHWQARITSREPFEYLADAEGQSLAEAIKNIR